MDHGVTSQAAAATDDLRVHTGTYTQTHTHTHTHIDAHTNKLTQTRIVHVL